MHEFFLLLISLFLIFGFVMLTLYLGKYKQRASKCCGGGSCGSNCADAHESACSDE